MLITILNRTTKSEGAIILRFRLRDGRAVDITHRSAIRAELSELSKFDADGRPSRGTRMYSKQLAEEIAGEMETMRTAYELMCADDAPRNNAVFARYMERAKNGTPRGAADIETRFAEWQRDTIRDGVHAPNTAKVCAYVGNVLHRFLAVESLQGIRTAAFDGEKLLRLREFIANEYLQVSKHPKVYADEPANKIPKKKRGRNTVTAMMRVLSAFFSELEDTEEIERTPFAKIGRTNRKRVFKVQFNAPIFCTAEELRIIRTAQVPEELEETRTAFVLHCALGCRYSDFCRLTTRNVSKHPDGFLFIHYLPEKTKGSASSHAEIETPLIKYAAEIIAARGGFAFKCLRNKNQYNTNIRKLFEYCGLNRECAVYSESEEQNIYKPMHELASSKIARKTAVDILTKAQINMYAAGLHREGSGAVNHYTRITTADRYALMCYAYGEKPYKATEDMRIIEITIEK